MPRHKQTKLEAVTDEYNPEIHEAGEKYLDARHEFQTASKACEQAKSALIEKMEQYGHEIYEDDGVRVILEVEDEPKKKLKVTDLTPKTAGEE